MNGDLERIELLIARIRAGDVSARGELLAIAYQRLYQIAQQILGRQQGPTPTLHTTALVNESVLRMFTADQFSDLQNAEHFFSRFAKLTRHALIDYQRQRSADKRGGEFRRLPLDLLLGQLIYENMDPLEWQDELDDLRSSDERAAEILELFYFGRFTVTEIAQAKQISTSSVEKDLRFGRAFIRRRLSAAGCG